MVQVTIPEKNNINRNAGSLLLTIEDETTNPSNLLKTGNFLLRKEATGFQLTTKIGDAGKTISVPCSTNGNKTLLWSWIKNNHRLTILDNDTKVITESIKENSSLSEDFGLIDLAVPNVTVDGVSYQNAGSGKNLFENGYLSNRDNFNLDIYCTTKKTIQLKGNTKYAFFIKKVVAPELGKQFVFNIHDGTDGVLGYATPNWATSIMVTTYNMNSLVNKTPDLDNVFRLFTTPESGKIFFSYYDNNKKGLSPIGDWFTDVMINAQLEEDSVATAYEPPAPTPDYPIPIESLNNFDIVSSVGGRNLSISNHSSSTKESTVVNLGRDLVVGLMYTLSFDFKFPEDIENPLEFRIFDLIGKIVSSDIDGNGIYKVPSGKIGKISVSFLLTSEYTGKLVSGGNRKIVLHHGTYNMGYVECELTNLKLEVSSTATPYSQAPENILPDTKSDTIYKTNILLSEPLRSVGDVKDRLFLDTDGLWKVERNVGEDVLDENHEWVLSKADWTRQGFLNIEAKMKSKYAGWGHLNKTDIKSNLFPTLLNAIAHQENSRENITVDTYVQRIKVSLDRLITPDINGWKDFVKKKKEQGIPFIVLYQLLFPTIETLPQSEQVKLNNFESSLFGNTMHLISKTMNAPVSAPYFPGHYKALSIYSEDVLYDKKDESIYQKLKKSGTVLFNADYAQPMHYAKKPFLEATMAPRDNSPVLIRDEDGPMRRQYFFNHETGVYQDHNSEEFIYRGEDRLMMSYDDLDPTFRVTVVCEGESLGEPVTVLNNQVVINLTPEQKQYWYGKTFVVTYRLAKSYTVEWNENTAHDSYLVRLENHEDKEITITQEGNRFSNERLMREIELNPIVNPRHSGFMYISTEEQKSQAFRLNLSSNYIIANGLDSADFIVEVIDQDGNEVLSPYLDVFIMDENGQITSQFGQLSPVINKDTLKAKNAAGRSYFKYQAPLIRTTDTKKTQKIFAVAYDRKHKIGAQVPLIVRPSEPVYDITGKSFLPTKVAKETRPESGIVFEYFARFYEKPITKGHPVLTLDKDGDGILTREDLTHLINEQTNAVYMQELANTLRETEAF